MLKTKGGYAMIDATGFDYSGTAEAQTVKGLFNQFAEAYLANKPVEVYNVELDGYRYSPTVSTIVPLADGSYQFTFLAKTLIIDSTDAVTLAEQEES